MKKKNKKIIIIIISLIIILIAQCFYKPSESANIEEVETIVADYNDLQVYYLDVGQADCILIRNQDKNMLIDAGNNEDGPKLVSYFKELGIKEFEYVIGTHPHEDHIGGLDDIINSFKVNNVLLPEAYTTTKTFTDVLTAIENNNLEITVPNIGDNINFAKTNIEVIYIGNNEEDLNNNSIVLKLTYGKYSYLFTGDATSAAEEKMLDKDIKADVLKVAHHGSEYSSTDRFLKKVNPDYAIISVGQDNSYGHPSDKTIERLQKYTQNIYQTKDYGTIVTISNGDNITIKYLNTNTNG